MQGDDNNELDAHTEDVEEDREQDDFHTTENVGYVSCQQLSGCGARFHLPIFAAVG
jgi:hypothetical protein